MSQINTARETLTRLAEEGFNVIFDTDQENTATLREVVEIVKAQLDGWLEENPAPTTRTVGVQIDATVEAPEGISVHAARNRIEQVLRDLANQNGVAVQTLEIRQTR